MLGAEGGFLFTGRQIMKNTLLLTAAALLLRLISMLFQSYLAGRIGAEGLGAVQLVLSVSGFATTLGLAGARVAATCLCAQAHGKGDKRAVYSAAGRCLRYVLVSSFLAAAALFAFAPYFAEKFLQMPEATGSLRLLAGLLPVGCVNLVLGGFFTATGQVLRLTLVDAGERLVCLGVTMLLLRYTAGSVAGACFALLGGELLSSCAAGAALYGAFLRGWRKQQFAAGPPALGRQVRRLAMPLALSDYLRAALRMLEEALIPWGLAHAGASRAGAMAAYGTLTGMVFPVLMFPAAFLYALIDLLIPELAACRAQERRVRLRSISGQCLRAGLLFASFLAGLLFVLARPLTLLLFQSPQAARLLRVFAPLALILYLDALVDGMLKGLSEQVATVRYNTITSAMDVVLLFFLLPRYGLGGYVVTFVVTHLVNFALSLRRLLRASGAQPPLGALLRTGLLTIPAIAAATILPTSLGLWGELALRAGTYTGVYLLLAVLSGTTRACLPPSLYTKSVRRVDISVEKPYNERRI